MLIEKKQNKKQKNPSTDWSKVKRNCFPMASYPNPLSKAKS